MAPALRRAALAAMHAADPLAPHRRLPARPVVVPAARLAARREPQIAAPPVAVRQRFGMGHGVNPRRRGEVPPPLSPDGAQGREVEGSPLRALDVAFDEGEGS